MITDYWTNQLNESTGQRFPKDICVFLLIKIQVVSLEHYHKLTQAKKMWAKADNYNISVKSHKQLVSLSFFHFGLCRSFSIKSRSNSKLYHSFSVTFCPTSCLFSPGCEVPMLKDDKRQYMQRLDLGPHMHQVAQIWYEKHSSGQTLKWKNLTWVA